MKKINKPILCIMGPTACGKTTFSLELASKYPLEIISVDSAKIYRTMDIGTAKPSQEILSKVPHHLINILSPSEPYSAAQFVKNALESIEKIRSKGKEPLFIGGTMMYYKALQQGLSSAPAACEEIRADILRRANEQGWAALHKELSIVDPLSAQRIHPNDPQRIQRALEVYQLTAKPLSAFHDEDLIEKSNYEFINIAIAPTDRHVLHDRIEKRFHHMLELGLVEEVESLYKRGDLKNDLPSIRSVGYRQVWQYLEGKLRYDEMVERAIIATRQLAKRQLTWLRHWPALEWFYTNELKDVNEMIKTLKVGYE